MRIGLILTCFALALPMAPVRSRAADAPSGAAALRPVMSYDPDFQVLSTLPPARVLPRIVPRFTPGTPGHPGHLLPLGPRLPPTILDGQVVVRPRRAPRTVNVIFMEGNDVLLLQTPGTGDAPRTFAAMHFDAAGMTVTVTVASTVFHDRTGRSLTVSAAPGKSPEPRP